VAADGTLQAFLFCLREQEKVKRRVVAVYPHAWLARTDNAAATLLNGAKRLSITF